MLNVRAVGTLGLAVEQLVGSPAGDLEMFGTCQMVGMCHDLCALSAVHVDVCRNTVLCM